MNKRSIIERPEPGRPGSWLDAYLPDNQLVPYQPKQSLIDVALLRGILFRQRWLIAAVIATASIIGLIVTLLATPMYEARATVQVQPYGNFIVEGQDVNQGIYSNQVYNYLATQVEIIQSRNLAQSIAEQQNLGERTNVLGKDVDSGRPPNMSDEQWLAAKNSMAASILKGSVSAETPDRSWVIPITFSSADPVFAAEMANAYAEAFVGTEAKGTIEDNEYALDYLREEISLTRKRLEEAERAANDYARNSGIIVQPQAGDNTGANVTLTSTNLSNINQRFSDARAARIAAEQRWRAIQNIPTEQLREVQNNPVLQSLITERTSKRAELVELRQRYNDQFPQIVNLRSQIETLDDQIDKIGSDIKVTARNDYVIARNEEQALQQERNALTSETLAEQDLQVQYGVLERQADALRDQLQALLNRFNQVNSAANVQTGSITQLDTATVPGAPYSPNLIRNMLIAVVLGAACAGGLALLREVFDDRIHSLEEVEEKVGLPLLGHTPHVEERDINVEGSDRFSALMESYASIRSTIDFTLPRENTVIQLTSTEASEGKSTTAVILAELFACVGRKTLLVDGDLRRPSVAKLVNIDPPAVGFMEVLLGHADLQSAVIGGVNENLDILPVSTSPSNPTEIFASPQLREFIEKYRREYDLILFDSSPILGLADAPMLARLVDGTIFVLEANRVRFGQARSAIKRLRASGGQPVGTILTKYRALEAGQGYNYQYRYYQYGSGS